MCSSKPLKTESELGSATVYFMENNNVAKLSTVVKHCSEAQRHMCSLWKCHLLGGMYFPSSHCSCVWIIEKCQLFSSFLLVALTFSHQSLHIMQSGIFLCQKSKLVKFSLFQDLRIDQIRCWLNIWGLNPERFLIHFKLILCSCMDFSFGHIQKSQMWW